MHFDAALLARSWPKLWQGFQVTLGLSAAILLLGTVLGLLLALARESPRPLLSWPATAYVAVFRCLPVLVVLYMTFYALPQVAFAPSPVQAALMGLTGASAAYLCEDLRGGLRAVGAGQWQAARALGLPYWRTLRHVVLPQAARIALPPWISRATVILKGTSVAGIVAVNELTGEAFSLIGTTYRAWEFLAGSALLYLAACGVLALAQAAAERRFARIGRA